MFGISWVRSGKPEVVSVSEAVFNTFFSATRGGNVYADELEKEIASIDKHLSGDQMYGFKLLTQERRNKLLDFRWDLRHLLDKMYGGKWLVLTWDGNRLEYRMGRKSS